MVKRVVDNPQTYYGLVEGFADLISNAFVHGNKLNFEKGVFFGWEVVNGDIIIRTGDLVVSEDEDFPRRLEAAKEASLTGAQYGLARIRDWSSLKLVPGY